MTTASELGCEICGSGWGCGLTITGGSSEPTIIRCDPCQRMVDAGILRLEIDEEGKHRYRQWHIHPMTPGELIR